MSDTTSTPASPPASPLDPMAAAILAAQAAAAQHIGNQTAGLPQTAPAPAQSVALPAGRAPALTMDDMKVGSISVDGWLGVKEHGFVFGTDKALYTENLIVEIDCKSVAPCYCIKAGNPTQYWKSYDRATESKGGPWLDAIVAANRIDPNAREYRSCEIPFELTSDVKIKGKDYAMAGQTFGHSLSTTNWSAWEKFWDQITAKGLRGSRVKVELGYEKRQNTKGNIWGIVTFKLLEA